jgi:hypothetical protein
MRLDLNPKLTESNQNSESWIGTGSDSTKNMVWIRGGAENNPPGRFGLDLIKFGPELEMLLRLSFHNQRLADMSEQMSRGPVPYGASTFAPIPHLLPSSRSPFAQRYRARSCC